MILGYQVGTNILAYTQEYHDDLQNQIKTLTSHSSTRISNIEQLASLSSYDTTREIQTQMIGSVRDNFVKSLQTQCDGIDKAKKSYQKKIDRMYPERHLHLPRKHFRTEQLQKLFDDEHSSLSIENNKHESLLKEERELDGVITQARQTCQNLAAARPVDQKKLDKANDRLQRKEGKLRSVRTDLPAAKEELEHARRHYRERFAVIYEQCRAFEEERLTDIRKFCLHFVQAIYPTDFANQQERMYQQIVVDIKRTHDIEKDLDDWAEAHGIPLVSPSSADVHNAIITTAHMNTPDIDQSFTTADRVETEI